MSQIKETETEVMVILTDVQLHSNLACNPKSMARGIQKAMRSGKPGRTYINQTLKITDHEAGTFEFVLPTDGLDDVIAAAKAKGKRVRFYMPKGGIPIFLGKDYVEKMAALKRRGGQR